MERRSTNDIGYAHFQGDLVSNVGSSHGVTLRGGSTGGIIEPIGDDTSISLTVRAKNAGLLELGNSTQRLNINSTLVVLSTGSVLQVGSTAPFAGFIRFSDTAISTPDFNTTNAMVIGSSVTITGANSSHFVLAQLRNNGVASTDMSIVNARTTSTANEVLFAMAKFSTVTVAASTATIDFLVFRF